ncbi:MAG: GHMP kinase [Methanobrevibacter sp.]|nr:GHMP kinase [Methanobrevibacter sp.]
MSVSVFTPAHITGFFTIENNKNPLKKGSCGAGFLLERGVKTTVKDSDEFKVNINQGSRIVINEVLKHFEAESPFEIIQDIQLPIGAGFGTSAASALSLSLALNEYFDFDYSYDECGQIAHMVEVSLGGGLGDVIAQTGSGIVLRTSPGAPGVGEIQSFDEDLFVATKFFGEIDTASVIQDPHHKKVISKFGRECLEVFKNDLSVTSFLDLSVKFSRDTKLMTDDVQSLVDYFNLSDDILGSSMAMLGNTLFAFSDSKSTFEKLNIEDLNIDKLYTKG